MKNLRENIMLEADRITKLFWTQEPDNKRQRELLWEPLTHPIWYQVRGQVSNSVLNKMYFDIRTER